MDERPILPSLEEPSSPAMSRQQTIEFLEELKRSGVPFQFLGEDGQPLPDQSPGEWLPAAKQMLVPADAPSQTIREIHRALEALGEDAPDLVFHIADGGSPDIELKRALEAYDLAQLGQEQAHSGHDF